MTDLLDDHLNLQILENLCSGTGVGVNISELSKTFKKHRNTIKSQLDGLFKNGIINRPVYPFKWLYDEYPLLVVVRADLPRNDAIEKFLREDDHIFQAFYVRDEEFNIFLIEYHRDLFSYGEWRKRILEEEKIPPRDIRYPAHAMLFSAKHMLKYQPQSPIYVMEEAYRKGLATEYNGYKMSKLCFKIMKSVMLGEGIRTNENLLAQNLDVHRKTIERRIESLRKENIISKPVCRFPNFFVPPDHILVYYLLEVRKAQQKFIKAIMKDPHIPIAKYANIGRYSLLLFGVFKNVEDHFKWEERYDKEFHDSMGAMKKIYLSPEMTASIDQQKVSLGIIKKRMASLKDE